MPALTCIPPSETLKNDPCLACFSEKELLALMVIAMSESTRTYSEDIPQLLVDSACWTCLSKKQMLQAMAAMLKNLFLSGSSISDIKERMKCIECSSQKQLQAAFMFLMCTSFQVDPNSGPT